MHERQTDILIIGGGVGGFTAALAAARLGKQVILIEETDRIGGQLTAQAVPPDEHPWLETTGYTTSYRRFRQAETGEAAGALAAFCIEKGLASRQVRITPR